MSRHAGRERKRMSPRTFGRLMNFYPPLVGMGLRVKSFSDDWSEARVELKLNRLNRNQNGTAFGGSINAMTDAFFPLLLMHQLGPEYLVWDQACEIEFRSPGTSTVYGVYEMPKDVVEEIRAQAADGSKVLRWFECDLTLADGTIVAHARRLVYVRKKRPKAA
ncbi:MAG TPA: DUF4442 domain-containing protein [Dermacoccus sp.]|nr:DUF4442 domain-containing protein [Dermacoccus nishinomiyaensis]HCQ18760.1 DUF4442 domain-containing protein [Dermacoccus sp.]